ncbi:unnamed protein product [Eruca vesicaria subsp. sativa]|uniref:B3 domain-containing protein n=1 Tax=Eruca vesicaria subsp. sativa TaxID=29727 RepID=A0ABC8JBT2_ERUVS|nr:unnamed protein product [Eruca vesicaria subsp. sativa]
MPMVKSDDHKFWKLDMLAKLSKTILEEKERDSGRTVKSCATPPEWLVVEMMKEKNARDPKLIIEKKLHVSDLNRQQSRLSIPINQLLSSDFLTEEETQLLHAEPDLVIGGTLGPRKPQVRLCLHEQPDDELESRKESVSVLLVDPKSKRHKVELRRWKMGAYWNYVVVAGWNNVLTSNEFVVDDVTVIWSFRYGGGKLCLALSPPRRRFLRRSRQTYIRRRDKCPDGRGSKQPRNHRASGRFVRNKGPNVEEMKRMSELKEEEIRSNKVKKRRKKEEREKRKEENVLRTGTKLQMITNPKTLKKIAKFKQRKHLKVVSDYILNGNKKSV